MANRIKMGMVEAILGLVARARRPRRLHDVRGGWLRRRGRILRRGRQSPFQVGVLGHQAFRGLPETEIAVESRAMGLPRFWTSVHLGTLG